MQADFEQKLEAMAAERAQQAERSLQAQAAIDAGNETKLRAILGQYKTRVAGLEADVVALQAQRKQATDAALLAKEELRRKTVSMQGMLDEYRTLVAEQGQQLDLLQAERTQVAQGYEQLIGQIEQAEQIKRDQIANELEQARARLGEQTSLHAEAGSLQRAHAALQLEHARLLASVPLLAESKSLAETEAARLAVENKRLQDEQAKASMMLYGHTRGLQTHHATHNSSHGAASASSGAGGTKKSAASHKKTSLSATARVASSKTTKA
jgi:hypothetical protein